MSMFDFTFEGVTPASFAVPGGTYNAIISDVNVKPTASGYNGFNITFTVVDGEYENRTIRQWLRLPSPNTKPWTSANGRVVSPEKQNEDAKSKLLRFLLDIGLTQDQTDSVNADMLIGRSVLVTVRPRKDDPGNVNVTKVQGTDSPFDTGQPTGNPFLSM